MASQQLLRIGMLVLFLGIIIIAAGLMSGAKEKSSVKFSVFGTKEPPVIDCGIYH